ncbi:T-cell activation inhibitor, mitochondrial [Plasmopara halstedii]|uniref:T-cell activation inhibitor, mitochondrial n=2 Tax=Plasmopara halstedii TaxID=4781 RepID=A0A0P1AXL2_PLAHL|nr:T-cell activation inhibitor, mitochondrial [Plasmopara halstedii]CEG47189.1 T-cell activation inhibitor, mitochondrial [Plasmopara halstedii]|eukprot:XP_024583558.1 T-cell activation inhibitor, mitochondrial [Plasmopara halstedii]
MTLRHVHVSFQSRLLSVIHTSPIFINTTSSKVNCQRLHHAFKPPFLPCTSQLGSTRTKVSERALRRKNLRKMKNEKHGKIPMLKETLRKLYLRTHPDLFGRYPNQQRANEESYKELLGILDAIEKHNEFPPAKTLSLPFFLKTPVEGEFQEVKLRLRTTGGACNTLVEEALGRFFGECSLPEVFQWGEGSWGKGVGKDAVENSNLGFDEDEEAREKARKEADTLAMHEEQLERSAPAFNPDDSGTTMADVPIENLLTELNEVFEIIAAVPLMDEEEYGELREHFEKGRGLDEINERGYSITAGTHKIWKGERNLAIIADGVDTDSALILQRILLHTLNIERKRREPVRKQFEEHRLRYVKFWTKDLMSNVGNIQFRTL